MRRLVPWRKKRVKKKKKKITQTNLKDEIIILLSFTFGFKKKKKKKITLVPIFRNVRTRIYSLRSPIEIWIRNEVRFVSMDSMEEEETDRRRKCIARNAARLTSLTASVVLDVREPGELRTIFFERSWKETARGQQVPSWRAINLFTSYNGLRVSIDSCSLPLFLTPQKSPPPPPSRSSLPFSCLITRLPPVFIPDYS